MQRRFSPEFDGSEFDNWLADSPADELRAERVPDYPHMDDDLDPLDRQREASPDVEQENAA